MTIAAYQERVKAHLISSAIVTSIQIVREREDLMDGHLRIRLTLADGSLLEFSEYVRRLPDDSIEVAVYSYHWADAEQNMIRRWDNAAHHSELLGAPHHIHHGDTGQVVSGKPINIYEILETISDEIR